MNYILTPPKRKYEKVLLGLDPGKTNHGIAVIGLRDQKLSVISNAVMDNPVSELAKKFRTGLDLYLEEIDQWVSTYKPVGIVAERFMTRGTMGTTIEVVGIMLGALATRYDLPIKLLSAATWKNDFRRRFTEQGHPELSDFYKVAGVTPHALDACLIGCYGFTVGLGQPMKYTPSSIIKQADETSCCRLTKRKRSIEDLYDE